MFRRQIIKLISKGIWTQFFAWVIMCLIVGAVICFAGSRLGLNWIEVIGTFLDPGVFGGSPHSEHPGFRFVVALLSLLFISSLLVSTITNAFNNVTDSARNGEVRYNLSNYILIIGTGVQAKRIIRNRDKKCQVVVFSQEKPDILDKDYIFYRGERDVEEDLRGIGIDKAAAIYIIGEDNEIDHDAKNLECLNIVKRIVEESPTKRKVKCYMTLKDSTTSEIYMYSNGKEAESGKLLMVDVINENDLYSEIFLSDSDFLPVLKEEDNRSAHFIILGVGEIAKSMAYTIAHMCHYPDIDGCMRRTKITIMDKEANRLFYSLKASRPELFRLSEYRYTDRNGITSAHSPENSFLDITWEFIDEDPIEDKGREILNQFSTDKTMENRIIVCQGNDRDNIRTTIQLPRSCKDIPVAVFLRESDAIAMKAHETGMYGKIYIFGPSNLKDEENLLERRSIMGQRVNHVYSQGLTSDPCSIVESNWYKQPESNKYSSIYSAIAMSLRKKCFDMTGERRSVYEAEHRRWNESELIMGYYYDPEAIRGSIKRKKEFCHNDIIPFNDLPISEQDKDKRIIDAMDYILNGTIIKELDEELKQSNL